ncbi:hypothetical protein SAMN06265219_1221 [Gracilimonas mengyeensis]|uniref:Uncharacterized protein n=1 Tax=Gracilimonas mengyeensis TaxID=1302730 RepID=A0A521FL40_9BACT|nr:hypothetical protein SAMN06265219_1221 [Gracilimonas mengyeensis]
MRVLFTVLLTFLTGSLVFAQQEVIQPPNTFQLIPLVG